MNITEQTPTHFITIKRLSEDLHPKFYDRDSHPFQQVLAKIISKKINPIHSFYKRKHSNQINSYINRIILKKNFDENRTLIHENFKMLNDARNVRYTKTSRIFSNSLVPSMKNMIISKGIFKRKSTVKEHEENYFYKHLDKYSNLNNYDTNDYCIDSKTTNNIGNNQNNSNVDQINTSLFSKNFSIEVKPKKKKTYLQKIIDTNILKFSEITDKFLRMHSSNTNKDIKCNTSTETNREELDAFNKPIKCVQAIFPFKENITFENNGYVFYFLSEKNEFLEFQRKLNENPHNVIKLLSEKYSCTKFYITSLCLNYYKEIKQDLHCKIMKYNSLGLNILYNSMMK